MAISRTDETLPAPGALRTFSQLVMALEDGTLHAEASELVEDIVRDLNHALTLDRKSSATLTVSIKFTADRGVIETVADLKVKHPPRIRGRSMLYVANGHFLSQRNPAQLDLPLRTVPEVAPEIRVVKE